MKKLFIFAVLVLCSICVAACSEETIKGKEFVYQGTPANVEITLGFDAKESRVFGTSGVNRYFGSYQMEGNKLTFSPLGSTMMAGPQDAMQAESAYLKNMSQVDAYEFKNGNLILITKDGSRMTFKQVQ